MTLDLARKVVAIETDRGHGAGFLVRDGTLVVTNLHLVVGAERIVVHFSDGEPQEVESIAALDPRRDLAVLRIDEAMPELVFAVDVEAAIEAGQAVFALAEPGTAEVAQARVQSVQALGDWLQVGLFEENLPESSAGGPLVDLRGNLLGIVALASTNEGRATVAVPTRYVAPMLESTSNMPLEVLKRLSGGKRIERKVPTHPIVIFEGSSPAGLELITTAIGQAIDVGAPTYNRGDYDGCARLYVDCAEQLIARRADCPGAIRALHEGLERYRSLAGDADAQAWAMRDCFDGLLDAISRWFAARVALGGTTKNKMLN